MRDYRVAMFGASRSGKSSLTTRFVHDMFHDAYDPTIEDMYAKELSIENTRASLEILDTEGVERFHSMRELYIRNSDAFVLVYDVTSKHSLEEVLPLEEQVRAIKGPAAPLILVAAKNDLVPANREAADLVRLGAKLASKMDAVHIVTSAKDNLRVSDVFETCVKLLRKQDPAFGHSRNNQSVSSASIDGLLFTPSEREARIRHRPTLKASVLRLKKSVVGLKGSKSIRTLRRAVSRASFYHSSHSKHSAENAATTSSTVAPTQQPPAEAAPLEHAEPGTIAFKEPQLELSEQGAAVAPVLQDSLTQPPEMLDVSGRSEPPLRQRGGVCLIM